MRSLCKESLRICTYPPGPLKHGPKLGSSQRPLKRPRRLKEKVSDKPLDGNSSQDLGQENVVEQQRSNSWDQELLSAASTKWQSRPELENYRMGEAYHPSTSTRIMMTHSLHPKAESFSAVSTSNSGPWKRYLDTTHSILTIISSSSIDHNEHVNPFLACTIWIAAAVQLVHRVFGPPGTNRRFLQSNFDRLRSNYEPYVKYWQTPIILLEKFNVLGPGLERLGSSAQRRTASLDQARSPSSNTKPEDTIPQDLETSQTLDPRDARTDGMLIS